MEQDELMARLHQELDRLGGLARELWDLLVRGMRLREVAAALDLSYDAAKRQRRKLIAHLRGCLVKEERPPAPRRGRGPANAPASARRAADTFLHFFPPRFHFREE